ncbi:hypothetical protein GCM10009850_092660 [Nonomuraea monospora]|uniref:Secreted protein n=1 Tax=Nonomuraea monospora TaxID=568818 RepID=A0ABN3CWD2_9ACTN
MRVNLWYRHLSRILLALVAAAFSIASLGLATPASAAVPDGHNCWYGPPSQTVNDTAAVQCDGPVRRTPVRHPVQHRRRRLAGSMSAAPKTTALRGGNVTLTAAADVSGALTEPGEIERT